jgi:hypothetical protein
MAPGQTLLAAARLDLVAYQTIAAGRRYWGAALLIVTLSAVSHATAGVAWATINGWAPIRSVVPSALVQFVLWLTLSIVAYAVGRILGSAGSLGGVLRAVGVAALPAVFYFVAVFPPLLLVMGGWWIATTYVALRAALALEAGRLLVALAAGLVVGYYVGVTTTVTVLDWLAALGYPAT